MQWLVRSTVMDVALGLVESQPGALDADPCVTDLLELNTHFADAKSNAVDFVSQPIALATSIVVASHDSSFGSAGKNLSPIPLS